MNETIRNCAEIKELLSLYMDGMLDDSQGEAVRRHLEACKTCRQEYEALQTISSLLCQTEVLPLAEGFDERLRQALKSDSIVAPAAASKKKKTVRWKKVSSLAAVFVIGIFGIVLYNNIDGLMPSGNESAQMPGSSQPEALKVKEEAAMDIIGDSQTVQPDGQVAEDSPADSSAASADTQGGAGNQDAINDSGAGQTPAVNKTRIDNEAMPFAANAAVLPETITAEEFSSVMPRRHSDFVGTGQAIQTKDGDILPTTMGGILKPRDFAMASTYVRVLENELEKIEFECKIVNYYLAEGAWYFEIELYTTDEMGMDVTEKYTYVGEDGTLWRKN